MASLKPKFNNYQSPGLAYKNTFMRAASNIMNEDNNTQNKIIYDSSNSQSSKNSQYK